MSDDEGRDDPRIVSWDRTTTERAATLRQLADEIEERLPGDDDDVAAAIANIRKAADQSEDMLIRSDSSITYVMIPKHDRDMDFEVHLMGQIWSMIRHDDVPTRRRIVDWLDARVAADEDAEATL